MRKRDVEKAPHPPNPLLKMTNQATRERRVQETAVMMAVMVTKPLGAKQTPEG
jgi:hypothetical protein